MDTKPQASLNQNFKYKFRLHDTFEAIKWFKSQIKDLNNKNQANQNTDKKQELLNSDKFKVDKFEIGKLYLFHYDPKHRTTLPYYDTFPLVMITEISKGNFCGLNLHYLPTEQRMVLLSNLMQKAVFNRDTGLLEKLNIKYDNLKNVQEFQFFQPCYKKYLMTNIKSSIKCVPAEDWGFAASLPIESFEKEMKQKVWKDSMATQDMTL